MPFEIERRLPPGAGFIVFRLPALLYMALIFYMSSYPMPPEAFLGVPDYFVHSLGYSLLYVLVFWAAHEGFVAVPRRGSYWAPALVTWLYGISDEYHQSFVPGREASVADVVADAAGAGFGVLAALVLARLASRARANNWT